MIDNVVGVAAERVRREYGLALLAREEQEGKIKIGARTFHDFCDVFFEVHLRVGNKKNVLNARANKSRFVMVGRRRKTSYPLRRILSRMCMPPK